MRRGACQGPQAVVRRARSCSYVGLALGLAGGLVVSLSASDGSAQGPRKKAARAEVAPGESSAVGASSAGASSADASKGGSTALVGEDASLSGELGTQVASLLSAWRSLGKAEQLRPRFLDRGDTQALGLPDWAADPNSPECATVVLLSTPNLSFMLSFADEELQPMRRAWPVPSAAGLAEVTRCGARKELLRGLAVQMRSRRGVLQGLVLLSESPPPRTEDLLPGRSSGPSMPSPQVGKRPYLLPLRERLDERSARYRSQGASSVVEAGVAADKVGRGNSVLHLAEGCHIVDVLAPQDKDSPPDIDARLLDVASNEVLVADEQHAGQASLRLCLGSPTRVRLDFSGARGHAELTVLHAQWAIPDAIPRVWGMEARAQLADAMWSAQALRITQAPLTSTIGVRGAATMHLQPEAGACYLFAAAPIRGDLKRLVLTLRAASMERSARSDGYVRGTALWFCSELGDPVAVEVQALGTSLAWIGGFWRVSMEAAP